MSNERKKQGLRVMATNEADEMKRIVNEDVKWIDTFHDLLVKQKRLGDAKAFFNEKEDKDLTPISSNNDKEVAISSNNDKEVAISSKQAKELERKIKSCICETIWIDDKDLFNSIMNLSGMDKIKRTDIICKKDVHRAVKYAVEGDSKYLIRLCQQNLIRKSRIVRAALDCVIEVMRAIEYRVDNYDWYLQSEYWDGKWPSWIRTKKYWLSVLEILLRDIDDVTKNNLALHEEGPRFACAYHLAIRYYKDSTVLLQFLLQLRTKDGRHLLSPNVTSKAGSEFRVTKKLFRYEQRNHQGENELCYKYEKAPSLNETPLATALRLNREDAVCCLLAQKELEIDTKKDKYIVNYLFKSTNYSIINRLLNDQRIDVTTVKKGNQTLLEHAIKSSRPGLLATLLKRVDIDTNSITIDGDTRTLDIWAGIFFSKATAKADSKARECRKVYCSWLRVKTRNSQIKDDTDKLDAGINRIKKSSVFFKEFFEIVVTNPKNKTRFISIESYLRDRINSKDEKIRGNVLKIITSELVESIERAESDEKSDDITLLHQDAMRKIYQALKVNTNPVCGFFGRETTGMKIWKMVNRNRSNMDSEHLQEEPCDMRITNSAVTSGYKQLKSP